MAYVLHTAMAIDKAVLHRDRCLEVPTNVTHQDHWTGVWQEIINKEQAYEALDLSPAKYKIKCSVCKP